MKKILIGSPVRQKANILREFLLSLSELNKEDLQVAYLFVDDCDASESSDLLRTFKADNAEVDIVDSSMVFLNRTLYDGHNWDGELIERVAGLKNAIIDYARKMGCDFLFLVDSDLVLHPETLRRLLSVDREIVSNIFWTKVSKGDDYEPQVWLMDQGFLYDPADPRTKNRLYRTVKKMEFISALKEKGTYRVGGLGACTLISQKVLSAGVTFDKLYNISFWGEDRAFCIRAVAAGFELFVDTFYPAYHIYRESYLRGVAEYKKSGFSFTNEIDDLSFSDKARKYLRVMKTGIRYGLYHIYEEIRWNTKLTALLRRFKKNVGSDIPKITLSMVVRNEASAYLAKMLASCSEYIDDAVIIDDASTDDTVQVCEEALKNIPHKIIRNSVSMFSTEWRLRRLQWEETVKMRPEWVLFLDADEIFEARFKDDIRRVLSEDPCVYVYAFRRYDLWDEKHYREDSLWNAHLRYEAFMLRYDEDFRYLFTKRTNQHCGRMPNNIKYLKSRNSSLRLKHYGWIDEEKRREKYERYMRLDPEGKDGSLEQYKSILDEAPRLMEWKDEEGAANDGA